MIDTQLVLTIVAIIIILAVLLYVILFKMDDKGELKPGEDGRYKPSEIDLEACWNMPTSRILLELATIERLLKDHKEWLGVEQNIFITVILKDTIEAEENLVDLYNQILDYRRSKNGKKKS